MTKDGERRERREREREQMERMYSPGTPGLPGGQFSLALKQNSWSWETWKKENGQKKWKEERKGVRKNEKEEKSEKK